jgi:hypothetical protein
MLNYVIVTSLLSIGFNASDINIVLDFIGLGAFVASELDKVFLHYQPH